MKEAGVKVAGGGSRTLRHSWAIRALAHNSSIKSIADVDFRLGSSAQAVVDETLITL
jgi:hypothetical protein